MRRVLIALLALPVLAVAAVLLGGDVLLNSEAVRSRVTEAVQRATGHGLVLGGRLHVAWSFTPSVALGEATLLNPPGFSRPAFATVRRIEARLALSALLGGRFEVTEVVVEAPDVVLERDASGRGNWLPPPPPPPSEGAAPAAPRARTPVAVGRVVVQDGRVAFAGAPAVELPRLVVSPAGGALEGRVVVRGVGFTLAGRTGAADRMPMALELTAVGGGLALSVNGEVGGVLAVQVLVPELAALQALAERPLPAFKQVALAMEVAGGAPRAMRLVAGASELGAGVRLHRLEAAAAGWDQPLTLTAEAGLGALAAVGTVNLASPARMLAGGALPFQALLLADGGSLAVTGAVDAATRGVDATVSGSVPDLRRSGALAGVVLPAVQNLALNLRVLPAPGGAGVLLRGIRVSMAHGSASGDVAGDLAIGFSPRASVRGTLQSQSLDLDALLAKGGAAPVAPPAPAPSPAPAPASVAASAAAPVAAAAAGPIVPPLPLPFAALGLADADLRLVAGQVMFGGAAYRAVEARVLLQDGRLRIDPAQGQAPGGPVQAQVLADSGAAPPTAALVLRATGLDAAAFDPSVSGALDLDIQLAGAGGDLRSLVLSMQGRIGAALVDGEVANSALAAAFGPVLRAANLPVDAQGSSRFRCLAVRVDAAGGIARVAALALDATRLRLEGEGAVNLVDDTMDMALRPTIRIGPTGVAIPVRLTGPVRSPKPELARGAIAPGRVGISIGGGFGDPCPAALTAARDGRLGRMP